MVPTEILSNEHRIIEIALNCLEQVKNEAIEQGRLEKNAASRLIDFIRTFADKCHHAKEEDILFIALSNKGILSNGGPIGQMLLEHEQGRDYVKGMADSINGAAIGDKKSLNIFSENASGYTELLRAHIQKEDQILFPMADRAFDEEDQKKVMGAFEEIESKHAEKETHEKYVKLIQEIAREYGIPFEGADAEFHCCGH